MEGGMVEENDNRESPRPSQGEMTWVSSGNKNADWHFYSNPGRRESRIEEADIDGGSNPRGTLRGSVGKFMIKYKMGGTIWD